MFSQGKSAKCKNFIFYWSTCVLGTLQSYIFIGGLKFFLNRFHRPTTPTTPFYDKITENLFEKTPRNYIYSFPLNLPLQIPFYPNPIFSIPLQNIFLSWKKKWTFLYYMFNFFHFKILSFNDVIARLVLVLSLHYYFLYFVFLSNFFFLFSFSHLNFIHNNIHKSFIRLPIVYASKAKQRKILINHV